MTSAASPIDRALRLALVALIAVAALFATTACDPEEPATTSPWAVSLESLDEALLAVWGSRADDVWIVGSDAGQGPVVIHYDGQSFERLDTGTQGTLWWVWGQPDSQYIWMAGDGGVVLRYDRTAKQFETIPTPSDAVLFGVYPIADDDVWAVGGESRSNSGVLLHYDGVAFTEQLLPEEQAALGGTWFKVWARSASDIWVVGLGSLMLHYDGAQWNAISTPGGRRLFTIHGDDQRAVAVGGFASGLIVDLQGDGVFDITPSNTPQLNGVWVSSPGDVHAVGVEGAIMRWDGSAWALLDDTPDIILDYHGVFVDDEGGVWAVGGHIVSEPQSNGILVYNGPRTLPSAP